ncbi:nucleoside/nucleotide kinase family protein [Azospirillum canadense]|uniref:hypothetical protein n=1 Tax=Azospirillum canadense TaxID=403962 RepID=UPI002227ABF3|nr:hypothetical protein [Azospirillum canadense]MCW2242254.1 hypothetical protein [Azospirillum canadense]
MIGPSIVIALTGLAGSGKSTVADRLTAMYGFRREKFAGPLKDMMRAFGLSEDEIEGDRKEVSSDLLCGATPRHAMRTLGTEWGRMLIHPDLWASAWRRRASTGRVVADDCRFLNEATAVRTLGGTIVRIERPGLAAAAHVSEQEMSGIVPDETIVNDGSPADLARKVDELVSRLLARPSAAVATHAELATNLPARPVILET